MSKPVVAHKIPGRIRIQIPSKLSKPQNEALLRDLEASPVVSKVTLHGSSLIIEHSDETRELTALGQSLNRIFPDFADWSDSMDSTVAKIAADPWVNKLIPTAFLGLAIATGLKNGTVLAGESAFALGYVAFDLYWKFQQENVVRKIEKGLSGKDKSAIDKSVAN